MGVIFDLIIKPYDSAMHTVTIRNLIKRTSHLQQLMALPAVQASSQSEEMHQNLLRTLTGDLQETNAAVDAILKDQLKTAADLPIKSRRAYQWVKFLSDPDHLQEHLDALGRINLFLPDIKLHSAHRHAQIQFSFYHLGSLYKSQIKTNVLFITAQESFIFAPDRVLIAILQIALMGKDQEARQIINSHTISPGYQTAREELEYLSIPSGSFAEGSYHQLENSFARVNKAYFQGKIPRPHLVWNNRLTFRKFGHYQWDTDTVMVSQTLDNSRVPEFVLDYVIYHELLHKKLGTHQAKERRIAHTRAFRTAEGRFTQYQAAQRYLTRLSRKKP